MRIRLLSGFVAAVLLVFLIYRGSLGWISVVVVALATISYWEFDRLMFPQPDHYRLFRLSTLICVTILSLRHGLAEGLFAAWFSFVAIGIYAVLMGNRMGDFPEALSRLSLEWLGFFYSVSLVGFILPLLELGGYARDWLLLLFLIVFVGDSFAYFGGKWVGRRPMATLLSPRKTVEGSIAGVIGSCLAAGIWGTWIHVTQMRWDLWFLVIATSLLAQAGDLFESLLKRSRAKKDSGTFLPGHGGVLDRLDGLVFASPFFFCTVRYLSGVL